MDIVVVPHADELAVGRIETEIMIAVEADVAIVLHVPNAIVPTHELAYHVHGVVFGAVVADDDLQVGVVLRKNRPQTLAQTLGAISSRNAN
jgi:hypothetical protein